MPSRKVLPTTTSAVTATAALVWIHAATTVGASTTILRKPEGRSDQDATAITSSTKILQVFVCQNTASGAGQDQGCPSHQPICVDSQQQSPAQRNAKGVNCVPCIGQFDTPMEPDWGCSVEKPLCASSSSSSSSFVNPSSPPAPAAQRAVMGTAGTHCMDYPCRNTHDYNAKMTATTTAEVDQGCTEEHPSCVDALGNDPPSGQPGVSCVAKQNPPPTHRDHLVQQQKEDTTTQFQKSQVATAAWGVIESSLKQSTSGKSSSPKSSKQGTAKCLILAGEVEPLPWNKAGQLPLCNGCPFGISKQCEIGAKQQKLLW